MNKTVTKTTATPFILEKSVVLVGLMGCGKSAIGYRLAKRFFVPFWDMDAVIEEKAGCSISDIFEHQGEAKFREMEQEAIDELLAKGPSVIATGGGAFINEYIRSAIQECGISIWLKAPFDILLERVSRKKTRPLLEQGDKAAILRDLMEKRYPIYEKAHITVESNSGPHYITVDKLVDEVKKITAAT